MINRKDDTLLWLLLATVVFGALLIWANVKLNRDCDKQGGVLIKTYSGMPSCVVGIQKIPYEVNND